MPRPVAFFAAGTPFKAFPEFGAFYGVHETRQLLVVPMLEDETPELTEAGVPMVAFVAHTAGEAARLAAINAEFGSRFVADETAAGIAKQVAEL